MDQLSMTTESPLALLASACRDVAKQTMKASGRISAANRKRFAQYFTPMPVARQMASMLDVPARAVVGDYGAGAGILGATVLGSSLANSASTGTGSQLTLQAYEIDDLLHEAFKSNMGRIGELAAKLWQPAPETSLKGDFVPEAPAILEEGFRPFLDVAILNPPYQKLKQTTDLAQLLRSKAAPTPNLYAAFILLAIECLKPGGQLVAIVPRSFCNGDYFKAFRGWLRCQGSIDWVVRYKRRSNVFRADNVLQENVVFRFRKAVPQTQLVRVSLSDDPECEPELDIHVARDDVLPLDDDRIYVPTSPEELEALHRNRALPCTLGDLGVEIFTGKVEDFRHKDQLNPTPPESGAWAPLVYAHHWQRGSRKLEWSPSTKGKPACLSLDGDVASKRLVSPGHYVVLKRISANDDRTGRVHPAVVTPGCLPGATWAFENHVQVLGPVSGSELAPELANGIAAFLASPDVDRVLKTISGTTQINCNDIRRLRFPTPEALIRMDSASDRQHDAA